MRWGREKGGKGDPPGKPWLLCLQVHTRARCKSDSGRAIPGAGQWRDTQKGCPRQPSHTGCGRRHTRPNLTLGTPLRRVLELQSWVEPRLSNRRGAHRYGNTSASSYVGVCGGLGRETVPRRAGDIWGTPYGKPGSNWKCSQGPHCLSHFLTRHTQLSA